MNIFGLEEYSIFTNAAQITNFNKNMLLNNSKVINANVSALNDEDVFQGMICDSIVDGWATIKNNLESSINTLDTTISTLLTIQNNYKSSDSTNESQIGGV